MKEIRRARDNDAARDVAMAVMHGSDRGTTGKSGRFVREARIAANLEHPNIVPVYDVGSTIRAVRISQ